MKFGKLFKQIQNIAQHFIQITQKQRHYINASLNGLILTILIINLDKLNFTMMATLELHKNPVISTENSHDGESTELKKKYVKITNEIKESFLNLIIDKNMSIKEASQKMRINYSSAKAILSLHRKSKQIKKKPKSKLKGKEAEFRQIRDFQNITSRMSICCSVGGRITSDDVMVYKTTPTRKVNLVVQIQSLGSFYQNQMVL